MSEEIFHVVEDAFFTDYIGWITIAYFCNCDTDIFVSLHVSSYNGIAKDSTNDKVNANEYAAKYIQNGHNESYHNQRPPFVIFSILGFLVLIMAIIKAMGQKIDTMNLN